MERESGIVLRVSILQSVALSRHKTVTRAPGNHVDNVSAWLSQAVTQAVQDVDYENWADTPWARAQLMAKAKGKGKVKGSGWGEQA